MIYILAALLLFGGVHIAYSSNLQSTTKWLGERISEKEIIMTTPSSYSTSLEIQTMVTPPKQKIRILLTLLIYLATFVVGLLLAWWVSIIALILLFACSALVSFIFLPRKADYWIKLVMIGLQNRISDYEKNGDHGRAENLSDFIPILDEWVEYSKAHNLDINKI